MQFSRFRFPAVMRLVGQKSDIHAQGKKAFLKSSREYLKMPQLRGPPSCSFEQHLESGEASTRVCTPRSLPGALGEHMLHPAFLAPFVRCHASVMERNWGGDRMARTQNIFLTGICCIKHAVSHMTSQNSPQNTETLNGIISVFSL